VNYTDNYVMHIVHLSWVLHKFIGGKQKGLRNSNNTSPYDYTYNIENVVLNYHCVMRGKNHKDKCCPVCGSKIKKRFLCYLVSYITHSNTLFISSLSIMNEIFLDISSDHDKSITKHIIELLNPI
jgi:hypothetical protein